MKATEALLWVTSVCVGLRKSQIKTLADLVSVAIEIGRVSPWELGRLLAEERQGAAKHAIKPTWRFTSNVAVHIRDAMQGSLRWLSGSRKRWKNHPLVVSLDWTQVRSFDTLMVARVSVGVGCHCCGPVTKNGSCTKARTTWRKACCGCLGRCYPTG